MKRKIILFVTVALMALAANAQSPFFKKCQNVKGVTTVYITKPMLEQAGDIEGIGASDKDLLKKKIDNTQIVTSKSDAGRKFMEQNFNLIGEDNGYELLMQVNQVRILRKPLGKEKFRYVVVSDEPKELTVVTLEGSLTLQDVMRATKK